MLVAAVALRARAGAVRNLGGRGRRKGQAVAGECAMGGDHEVPDSK